MHTSGTHSSDSPDLQRCLRDVTAFTALPAVWNGAGPRGIADSLADVMMQVLDADFVQVRIKEHAGEDTREVIRASQGLEDASGRARDIAAALARWLEDGPTDPVVVPLPGAFGDELVQ